MRSKSITSKSIFGGYKKGEDIVTAALLHLMELGGPALMNSLFGDIGVETTTHVNTQVKGKKSIPDGELRANYHIYIAKCRNMYKYVERFMGKLKINT